MGAYFEALDVLIFISLGNLIWVSRNNNYDLDNDLDLDLDYDLDFDLLKKNLLWNPSLSDSNQMFRKPYLCAKANNHDLDLDFDLYLDHDLDLPESI